MSPPRPVISAPRFVSGPPFVMRALAQIKAKEKAEKAAIKAAGGHVEPDTDPEDNGPGMARARPTTSGGPVIFDVDRQNEEGQQVGDGSISSEQQAAAAVVRQNVAIRDSAGKAPQLPAIPQHSGPSQLAGVSQSASSSVYDAEVAVPEPAKLKGWACPNMI